MQSKSTVKEIKERFDQDVERFSNLETGQQATIDAPLTMDLIANAALACNPEAENLLDIGCGAGNLTLKILEQFPQLNSDLLDLSKPMLIRAKDRVSWATTGKVNTLQADIREAKLEEGKYDIVVAAAVLHHLREEEDWENVFAKIFKLLAPGGSFWISDLVIHDAPEVQQMMWNWYGSYLEKLKGAEYRKDVFAYIAKEDSPRSLLYQLNLLEKVGFTGLEILHKNSCFAAFGCRKPK